MSEITAYTAGAVLGHVLGATTMPKPTVYFSLFNGDPSNNGVEVSGNSYARVQPAGGFTVSGRTATNAANTDFAAASGPWGQVSHLAIHDAPSGGNRIASTPLTTPQSPIDGIVVRVPAGWPSITFPQ